MGRGAQRLVADKDGGRAYPVLAAAQPRPQLRAVSTAPFALLLPGPLGARRPLSPQGKLFAGVVSIAVHLAIFLALFLGRAEPPAPYDPEPMQIGLLDGLPEAKSVSQPAPANPSPAKPLKLPIVARHAPPSPDVEPLPAGEDSTPQAGVYLSDGELAGARGAGAAAPGHPCDMVSYLQTAMRKDAYVQNAVAQVHAAAAGRAVKVWDGDWITSPGEDGKGLAGVRETMIMEIGFAPAACRAEPMHGLVVIALGDGPGAARLAFGAGQWRWSDLLFPRGGVAGHVSPRS